MTHEERVRLVIDRQHRFAILEFNRPDVGNAIDWLFVEELDRATGVLEELDRTGVIDALLLRARGRHFCVGGDLREFPNDPVAATPHIQAMATIAHRSTARLALLSVPVVARLQGAAAGAGVGFALLADLVVAGERASFTLAYAAVGLVPDGGVSWLLPRIVGPKRALDLLLTNRRVSAQEALDLGLVSRVVADSDLDDTVEGALEAMLALPGAVLRENKRLLRESAANSLTAHLVQEAAGIGRFAGSAFAQSCIARLIGDTAPPASADETPR